MKLYSCILFVFLATLISACGKSETDSLGVVTSANEAQSSAVLNIDSRSRPSDQIPVPEFDGFYILYANGELEAVRGAPATHSNPTYFGGGYCSDRHATYTSIIQMGDIHGFVVQDINIASFSFHSTHNGGYNGMCSHPDQIQLRSRSLGGNTYYYEPAEPLESGNLYVGWIGRTLWFVRVEH